MNCRKLTPFYLRFTWLAALAGALAAVPVSAYQDDPTDNLARRPGPALPGLTGNWSLDDGQGQVAQDSSGGDNGMGLTNVTWIIGRIGSSALSFDGSVAGTGGSRAWVSNTNYHVLPPTGQPFSVSFWFNPDFVTNGWRGLIGNDANGSNGWHVALHTSGPGTNELVFAATGPGASLSITGRTLLLPGQWHKLGATYDGTQGMLYLDGDQLASGTGVLVANQDPIFLGGGVGGYDTFPGSIDEVRACTNSLTAEDISLAGLWHFDENSGTFLADSSINGHHATLSDPTGWAPGKDGSGIDLSDTTIRIPNDYSDVLPPTGRPFSLSFWLYPNSIPSGWSGLMSCADSTNTGWTLALYSIGPGQAWVHFCSTNSGGTLALYAPANLPSEEWSKLDLTFNGGIATLYVNGRKLLADSGGIQGNKVPLIVGAVRGMPNFNGVIDDLKIYRRERGESEVGPVAKVMWETVLLNSATNLILQGSGPAGKTLTYSIVSTVTPTNGTVSSVAGTPMVTYTAGTNRGPDAFAYTVSNGEFTSPPAIVTMSVVVPHWLSPNGGPVAPQDGSTPDQAWRAGPADALDAIWHTNNYYDCFFYAPGEYQNTGCYSGKRGTANAGCKHIGAGSGFEPNHAQTGEYMESLEEGIMFGLLHRSRYCDGFEVRDVVIDCNATNNPKYALGEPVWITIPLAANARVDSISLYWGDSSFDNWYLGAAQQFSICTRVPGTGDYVTNCSKVSSTGQVDTVLLGVVTDQIMVRLERRPDLVDFYSLSEIEVTGAPVSLPTATVVGGGVSSLDPGDGNFSILRAVDGAYGTAWASGPETNQVRIVLPLEPGTTVSQVNLTWNCRTLEGWGRLGPAADYQFQARDTNTGTFYDVPFVRHPRTAAGLQVNTLGTAQAPTNITTDQIVLLLNSRVLGVDFYSLREINLHNGPSPVAMKLPTALNNLSWGNYQTLMAFDGDFDTQWASETQGMCGAIQATGNNMKFTHLKIVGFGTKAARECFPMFITTPSTDLPPERLGNVLMEDCLFTDPAPDNRDGLTTVTLLTFPPHSLTNTVVRNCTVSGVMSHFRYSHAFCANQVESCVATDCQVGVYFEPNPAWGDNVGKVLIRSNQFLNVDYGVCLAFAAGAQFDSLTCLGNEIVLTGAGGWGFQSCDTCNPGTSGSLTNATILNNVMRFEDWALHPAGNVGGLFCGDIHNAVFGNNLVVLGTPSALRLRNCPSGSIPPPPPTETCDSNGPIYPPPGPSYPPCLDVLPTGYRRAWFQNGDLQGSVLKVRYWTPASDGFASQQQWP